MVWIKVRIHLQSTIHKEAMKLLTYYYHSWKRFAWWRHQMETFSALLAICAGNSLVLGEFPTQRPVTRSFDVFIDLRLNKRLSKQPWGWWFESLSCPLWRHRNGHIHTMYRHSNRDPGFGYRTGLLTQWGRDKMAAISQTTLSNAFS